MNNFDFASNKYKILLIIICIIFLILVIKAFDYLPESIENVEDINTQSYTESPMQISDDQNTQEQEEQNDNTEDDNYSEEHKRGHIDFYTEKDTTNRNENFVEIDAPVGTNEDISNQNNNLQEEITQE